MSQSGSESTERLTTRPNRLSYTLWVLLVLFIQIATSLSREHKIAIYNLTDGQIQFCLAGSQTGLQVRDRLAFRSQTGLQAVEALPAVVLYN